METFNDDLMILYKYFAEHLNSFKSLSMRGIWCHYSKLMNDPAECLAYMNREITHEQIQQFRNCFKDSEDERLRSIYNFCNDQVVSFVNMQRRESINRYAFGSLSKSFDDIRMWSHYASSHSGFVVEFDFESDHHFQEIVYTDYLPKIDVIKIADHLKGVKDNINYFLKDISVKAMAWQHEQEYRIWRRSPCYYHFDGNNIKSVYFGVNCSLETKAIVGKLIVEINDKVQYYNMELSPNPVRLTFNENFK